LLVAFQSTEFATKVGILGALVMVCAVRPVLEGVAPAPGAVDDRVRVRARTVPLVALLLVAYLTWVVGLDRRFGNEVEQASVFAGSVRTPIGDARRPPVDIDPSAERIASGFDRAKAEAAALDVVIDLETEVRAVRQRDDGLAKSSSTGERLDLVLRTIEAARTGRAATLPTYRLTRMRAVLSRSSPQSPPELRFETTAVVVSLLADGTFDETTAREATVVIRLSPGPGGSYLIAAAS
jgi:hypothetical protein